VTWKRGLAALGILMTGESALILAFAPNFPAVFLAEFLQGGTAGIVTPAIGAISLGLVGRRAMSVRTGRNYRFAAAGHALTAAFMGVAGVYIAKSAIFTSPAILCIPALIALACIRAKGNRSRQGTQCHSWQKASRQYRTRSRSGEKPQARSVHRGDAFVPARRRFRAAADRRERRHHDARRRRDLDVGSHYRAAGGGGDSGAVGRLS
jgi:MFS family permease